MAWGEVSTMILAEFGWSELVDKIPLILFVTFIFGGWVIVAVVRSFTDSWRRVREAEQNAALKQSMVEKGMSADEIERVLKAGTTKT
jgi:hypothetical protein